MVGLIKSSVSPSRTISRGSSPRITLVPAARQLPWKSAALAGVWNAWLRFQEMDGTRQTVYRHWVEGIELRKDKS